MSNRSLGENRPDSAPRNRVKARCRSDRLTKPSDPDGAGGSGARGVPILLCPCGSADVKVLSGQQLTITSVKVA